jgi:GLPGLI family protein
MKKLVLILGIIVMAIAAHISFGQSAEGVITYETRINNHRGLAPDQQGRRAIDPEFRILKNQLFFSATEALFKPLIEEEEDEAAAGNGRRRFQPKTQYYTNQTTEKVAIAQSIRGKDYLIEDSVKVSPWKFGTELKVILGYTCKQAFYTDTTKKVVTAWYTDKLRPFLGPERYNTLPGAVLAVDINNAERVLVATKIEPRPLKNGELVEPTKGQKITPAEFRKLMQQQFQSFRNRPRN